jgi:hypothetical protein
VSIVKDFKKNVKLQDLGVKIIVTIEQEAHGPHRSPE